MTGNTRPLQVAEIQAALDAGFRQAEIAAAYGVTSSAVAQFVEANGMKVASSTLDKYKSIDERFDRIEEMAAAKLEQGLRLAVLDPVRAAAVLKTVNGLKRRSLAEGMTGGVQINQTKLVTINLPQRIAVKATLNSQSEVIDIDGRTIATIDSTKISELSEAQKEKTHANILSKII